MKQEKLLRVIIQSVCIYFVGLVVIMISNILVIGLYGNEAYDPSYYEFTNGNNTVVIEEKSFLLYGEYDVLWKGESVEITYKTFTGNNDKNAIKVLLR